MSPRTTVIAITIFAAALLLLSGPASVAEKGRDLDNDIRTGNRSQFSKSGNQPPPPTAPPKRTQETPTPTAPSPPE
jgi:hypothetical protein